MPLIGSASLLPGFLVPQELVKVTDFIIARFMHYPAEHINPSRRINKHISLSGIPAKGHT